ncbi:rhamnogalacturonan acetylesterase [Dyadobacter pollutisoli]|uniref:Rhamnogalacturonan acetylesterase n=1 Tax=Dyadobacter pollutisoli TaxID=2910158 RepID=A0A9E8SNY7_9BACT|nr:rhamnogalacturonan acetylesterase [Dyadobacter pollutisoli]WAC14176.1 rhamnogalacturonan acetylesterase [Dyadobacter pollutisoli]
MLKTYLKRTGFAVSLWLVTAFAPHAKISVYLIGDSTMAVKQVSAYPETGWGMPFAHFFDDSVVVVNGAMNGRSTRTFIEENRWQPISDKLREGDFVLIQFGHNDEVKTKKSYTTEAEFQSNLQRFIDESQAKKATPILITPVARRSFDASGKIVDTHTIYAELVRSVAIKNHLPWIDLDKLSRELLQKMGPENSKFLFLHLEPDEHPNYPEGKEDNTHFSELGARKMAELVLADMKRQKIALSQRVVQKSK